MPGDYEYIADDQVFTTVYWGQVTLVDILETISRRIHHPDLREASGSIIDLSNATWTELPPQYVHQEVNRLRSVFAPPKLPTVFVTPGEFFYGFARMYALVQVIYGAAKVDVVRTWEKASEILGRDLTRAETWARQRVLAGTDERTTKVRLPEA